MEPSLQDDVGLAVGRVGPSLIGRSPGRCRPSSSTYSASRIGPEEVCRRHAAAPARRARRRARGRSVRAAIACASASRSRGSSISTPLTPSTIWSWIPPTRVPITGLPLPHRLGDGQPEALGEALLHDDVGPPLQRVDHRRVFVEVVHRQAGEMDPARGSPSDSSSRQARSNLAPDRCAFGVVGDRGGGGAGEDEMRLARGQVALEAGEQAEVVLEPVPARDLGDHRRARRAAGSSWRTSARRSTRPGCRRLG